MNSQASRRRCSKWNKASKRCLLCSNQGVWSRRWYNLWWCLL